jgi:hypothetical protein
VRSALAAAEVDGGSADSGRGLPEVEKKMVVSEPLSNAQYTRPQRDPCIINISGYGKIKAGSNM